MPGKTLYCLGEAWLELNSPAPLASAETFSPRMGGSAASLALAYAAQGGRASLLTQLGEDAFGHRIADALSTAGVDISRVYFTSHAPTPLLFDGGGETLACRTRSSELLYAPEQLGADWAADEERDGHQAERRDALDHQTADIGQCLTLHQHAQHAGQTNGVCNGEAQEDHNKEADKKDNDRQCLNCHITFPPLQKSS